MGRFKEFNPDKINLRLLIIGDYGTGKSTFASTFPEPIFLLDFDDGRLSYLGKKVYIPDCFEDANLNDMQFWNALEIELEQVQKGTHPEGKFRTIVIDSLTTLTKKALSNALMKRPVAQDSPPVWNVHYPIVKVQVDKIIDKIKKMDTNVVVIGHAHYEKNDLTGEIIVTPSVTGNLRTYLPALFDEVYFADVIQTKQGRKYVVNVAPVGFRKARSRLKKAFNLPDQFENDYKVIEQLIKKGGK